jgi:hypothetical protein
MATQNNTGLIVLSSVLGVAVLGGGIYLLTNKAAAAKPPKPLPPVNTGGIVAKQSAGNAAAQAAAQAGGAAVGNAIGDLITGLFKPSKAASNHPAGQTVPTVPTYDNPIQDPNSPSSYDPSQDPNSDLYGYDAGGSSGSGNVGGTLSYDNPSLSAAMGDTTPTTDTYGDFLGADGTTVKKVFDTETVFAAVLTGAAVLIYSAYWKSQKD